MLKNEFFMELINVSDFITLVKPEISDDRAIRGLRAAMLYVHYKNVEAGWWTNLETGEPLKRDMGNMLALCISELAEVPETGIYSVMDDHLPDRTMFVTELADFCIRGFDIAGNRQMTLETKVAFPIASLLPVVMTEGVRFNTHFFHEDSCDLYLMKIIRNVSRALEAHRKKDRMNSAGKYFEFDFYLMLAIVQVFDLAAIAQVDLVRAIMAKVDYNAQRADHKPENRKGSEGKLY